nr:hypothetical protein BDOA9_0157720 [Bradyrhizobium sp. DOA9]
MMLWFSVCHSFFQRIGENARSEFGKLVALLFCVPCFKLSHFFFKLAYTFQQRKLCRLCRENFLLEIYNRPITSDGFVDVLQSLGHIKRGLDRAETTYRFRNNHANPPPVSRVL